MTKLNLTESGILYQPEKDCFQKRNNHIYPSHRPTAKVLEIIEGSENSFDLDSQSGEDCGKQVTGDIHVHAVDSDSAYLNTSNTFLGSLPGSPAKDKSARNAAKPIVNSLDLRDTCIPASSANLISENRSVLGEITNNFAASSTQSGLSKSLGNMESKVINGYMNGPNGHRSNIGYGSDSRIYHGAGSAYEAGNSNTVPNTNYRLHNSHDNMYTNGNYVNDGIELSETGSHREMAIDCPPDFPGVKKEKPLFPPRPGHGSRSTPNTPSKHKLTTPASLPPPTKLTPAEEKAQMDRIIKYQEDIRKRRESEDRITREQEFLRTSLRGSKKLQALEENHIEPHVVTTYDNPTFDEEEEYQGDGPDGASSASPIQAKSRGNTEALLGKKPLGRYFLLIHGKGHMYRFLMFPLNLIKNEDL